jgi:hypothetical protein
LQASIAIGLGDAATARACLREAIAIMTEIDNRGGLVNAILVTALFAAETGDGARAARPYAAALKMRSDHATGATPMDILGLPDAGEQAKALLGERAYDAACREGASLPLEAVVAEAQAI